ISGVNGVENAVSLGESEKGSFDIEVTVDEDKDIRRDLFKRIADRGWYILGLKSNEMTLEDIFLKITMGADVKFKDKKPVNEGLQRELAQQIGGAVAAAEVLNKVKDKTFEYNDGEEADEGGEEE
ncbi:MAG: hypothetical protein IKR73_09350, partial [Oscillospiraceae bacterium]|nr:hypothetical protein [Oscillospiraceae bacterium]